MSMNVKINGIDKTFIGSRSVSELFEELGVEPAGTAVVCNGDLIRHPDYANTCLQDGDSVEIVQIVGGG